jgi:hypothetical protein
MLQGRAFKELHHDVGAAILFADVVDRANVGMVERRGRLSFTLESLQGLMVPRQGFGQEFECGEAVQLGILGLVDHTHPAATKLLQNPIVGNGFACHCGRTRP